MQTIRIGSKGPDVAEWQRFLAKGPRPTTWMTMGGATRSWPAGWAWPLAVDGHFGQQTQWATEAWQFERGLLADGIVGPNTWQASGISIPPPRRFTEILRGTDLSAIQGIRPDSEWKALADMGIRFAIMRSVVGNETWNDGAASENARRAREHGIEAWPYIFLYPLPHLAPDVEAETFVRRLEAMGMLGGPVASDAEWPPREERAKDGTIVYPWKKWGCSAPQIRDWLARFLDRLERLIARRSIVYSYRYWLRCIEAWLLPELADRPLWLADYGYSGRWPTVEQCAAIVPPAPWREITILQHDGNGGLRLPQSGIDADFNVFFGGERELAEFVGRPSSSDAEPNTVPEFRLSPSVRLSTTALIVDDAIAAYRRRRIDELPA